LQFSGVSEHDVYNISAPFRIDNATVIAGRHGRGKIGYVELQRLEDVNAQNILSARIIENQFVPEEWGGANELQPLQDGRIGVIGHIAYQDAQGGKHYYAMSFVYDPETHRASPIEIISRERISPRVTRKRRSSRTSSSLAVWCATAMALRRSMRA